MSATSSGEELNATTVIGLIESGAYPPEIIATIARGFLPLPQEELIGVLAYLSLYIDQEIAGFAREALRDIPMRALSEFAAGENIAPEHLVRLMRATQDPLVLEALIRNRAVPDNAVAELAAHAEPRVQEVVVINQARILRAPHILDALLENPAITADVRRRALEVREEFFLKKARRAEELEAEEEVVDLPLDAIADLLERAAAQEAEDQATTSTVPAPPDADEKARAIWNRLQFMSVAEKVRLAFRGDRMVRMLLVRDRNRLICAAVMRNPRMSEQEVEAIAGMRNVDEEVLRILGTRRDRMGKYNVMLALCRNPKAPIGVVLPFVNRLTLRDLKGLKDDKGVTQVVREAARRAYGTRTQKTG